MGKCFSVLKQIICNVLPLTTNTKFLVNWYMKIIFVAHTDASLMVQERSIFEKKSSWKEFNKVIYLLLFYLGSTHLVDFTCFGHDQNGNYGDLDHSFEHLSFQVRLGPDGTDYCKDLSRLLISMEKRYNKDKKDDPDLLIDYPRKGQVCAVLYRRNKEQKEDQCFRGNILLRTKSA